MVVYPEGHFTQQQGPIQIITLMMENSMSMYSLSNEMCSKWNVVQSGPELLWTKHVGHVSVVRGTDFEAFRPNLTSSLSRAKYGSCDTKPNMI